MLACPALRLGLFTSGQAGLMATLLPPKPFKSLPELAALLSARGMVVADPARAERKLGQVGEEAKVHVYFGPIGFCLK